MKTISVDLVVEDDEAKEVVEWLKRELLTPHPWIPGTLLKHVKAIYVGEPRE